MKYQVIIIGGGPAGYTAAEAAGKAGLGVLLFEMSFQRPPVYVCQLFIPSKESAYFTCGFSVSKYRLTTIPPGKNPINKFESE